jgi:hypothetical protein
LLLAIGRAPAGAVRLNPEILRLGRFTPALGPFRELVVRSVGGLGVLVVDSPDLRSTGLSLIEEWLDVGVVGFAAFSLRRNFASLEVFELL